MGNASQGMHLTVPVASRCSARSPSQRLQAVHLGLHREKDQMRRPRHRLRDPRSVGATPRGDQNQFKLEAMTFVFKKKAIKEIETTSGLQPRLACGHHILGVKLFLDCLRAPGKGPNWALNIHPGDHRLGQVRSPARPLEHEVHRCKTGPRGLMKC